MPANPEIASSAAPANGASTPNELFALTDEQILEIQPDPQDVEVAATPPAPEGAPAAAAVSQATASADPTSAAASPAAASGPFTSAEDVQALAELYPGGMSQAKTAAERARLLDDIDRAYFGAAGNSPEQTSAARAQLAVTMLREDPAAFREMVFAGLRALEDAEKGTSSSTSEAQLPRLAHAFIGASSAPAAASVAAAQPAAPQSSSAASHEAQLAAYAAFEKAANEDLERTVGGAIERTLESALPATSKADSAALKGRLASSIRQDVEKALQGDRQLGEQIAQILSARRFDNETRAQVVRLINDRASQLMPGAARRIINEWTQTTLAAHGAKSARSEMAGSKREVAPAAPPQERTNLKPSDVARGAAHPSKVDYRKLSDEQILDL
jgi:hypothetical protein